MNLFSRRSIAHRLRTNYVKRSQNVVSMDEVDGMSGADRGGIATLIDLIKKTRVMRIAIK